MRELRNFLNRLDVIYNAKIVTAQNVGEVLGKRGLWGPQETVSARTLSEEGLSLTSMEDYEKYAIKKSLAKNNNRQDKTAADLGIGLTTLYRKMKKYQIRITDVQ